MDIRGLADFCWTDRDFFDALDRIHDDESRYSDPIELDDAVWRRAQDGGWIFLRPSSMELPEQGWKIHVSATLSDASKVLEIVWRYCVERSMAFKFLRSGRFLFIMNEKNAPRQGSGKFITIYPRDNGELETTLSELGDLLTSFSGPYVLSDLRYREGPLYVRYGAFRKILCQTDEGDRVHGIQRPDGSLVPDVRAPNFSIPEWVELPRMLIPDLEARRSQITEDFPYRIDGAIQFSNSGGIYLATAERTGARVVVREARPLAGLDPDHQDAVSRLRREKRALERLAGLDCVPRLIDYRVVRGHHYLIEEHIEGRTLLQSVIVDCPLVDPDVPAEQRAAYTSWADHVFAEVASALDQIHGRGLSFGDLHPSNIMVRPDDTVVFVDFEFAAELTENRRPKMAAAGYTPPAPLAGADADRHALERVRVMTLLPLTKLIERDGTKAATLVGAACAELPVASPAVRRLRRSLGRGSVEEADDRAGAMFADVQAQHASIKESLVAAIHASATVARADRLFPGDPGQFTTGGTDLATGAAGVLYALHRTGNPVPEEYLDWLADRARTQPDIPTGLYTGMHGVAVVLDLLGRRRQALEVLERAGGCDGCAGVVDLRSGLAGVALSLLHLAQPAGDAGLLASVTAIADRLDGFARDEASAAGLRLTGLPGLMQGAAGVAMLFLRLFEETGDASYLDSAERCLRRDLAQCVTRRPGTLYVLDGSRNLPYLDTGSLGLAVVLSRYLRHRQDSEFMEAVTAVRRSCAVPFIYLSGIQQGRSGLILGLAAIGDPHDSEVVLDHTRRLGWHAINYRNGITFPGAQLLRLSMDLFTGSAGVLLAVHAALTDGGTFLPLLE